MTNVFAEGQAGHKILNCGMQWRNEEKTMASSSSKGYVYFCLISVPVRPYAGARASHIVFHEGKAVSATARAGRRRKTVADLKNCITAVNWHRRSAFHVSDAVAFGDSLVEIPRVQPAQAAFDSLLARGDTPDRSAKDGLRGFLRRMRGKGGVLPFQSYPPWISSRSDRRLAQTVIKRMELLPQI
jgi:hypothetical protein